MISRSKSGISTLAPVVILVSQGPQQQGEVRTRHHMAASSPVRPLFSHLTTISSDGQTHSPLAFFSLRSTLLPRFCLFFSLGFSFLSPRKGMEGPHHQKNLPLQPNIVSNNWIHHLPSHLPGLIVLRSHLIEFRFAFLLHITVFMQIRLLVAYVGLFEICLDVCKVVGCDNCWG